MDEKWYVVYETSHDVDSLDPIITHFVGGFLEEKDAKAFLKLKKREKADSIRRGWISFFIEERPKYK